MTAATVNTNPVQTAFNDAAAQYSAAAQVQRQAAQVFADWLAVLPISNPTHISEIGCGTGFLTEHLAPRHAVPYCATDLAPAMLQQAQARLPDLAARIDWQVWDGQNGVPNSGVPNIAASTDWLVSALCAQWLHPLDEVLARWLAQSHVVAFSVVLDDSFSAWRNAHAQLGLSSGLQPLPNWSQLQAQCLGLGAQQAFFQHLTLNETHANALAFAHSVKAIGAHVPRAGHRSAGLRSPLRQVLKALPQPCTLNYEIGFVCLVK
ncbi:methyltransferase [Parvibium lacunae]|uniref:Methyltransferase domain-containing protein n=1 Tax=Parvibium lacunae TaxID=1888893 RepID=A0A368L6J1_9BURK|nr:methyltransferase [Parvibium lacunae]RCS59308.1 methyltransferase domain-containing protein [Parvibium lacunae]